MNPLPGQDRRTFLKGAGIVGAASLAGPLLATASAGAASRKVIYGANDFQFGQWVANAPSPDRKNSERRYFDAIVPYDDGKGDKSGKHHPLIKDWDSMGVHTNYAIVSLRVNPVYALQRHQVEIPDNGSGFRTLDGQLTHLLSTMPAHAVLTNWQEAGPSNTLKFPSYVDATRTRRLHNHVQHLTNKVKARGGHVNYGQILIDNPTHPAFISWLGNDLDTYMVDIYDFPNGAFRNGTHGTLNQGKINRRMDGYKAAFSQATSATPLIHITETNSPNDGHRANWFLFLTEWMLANNGFRIVSHWHPNGPDSGAWPPSPGVLRSFRTLQHRFGA